MNTLDKSLKARSDSNKRLHFVWAVVLQVSLVLVLLALDALGYHKTNLWISGIYYSCAVLQCINPGVTRIIISFEVSDFGKAYWAFQYGLQAVMLVLLFPILCKSAWSVHSTAAFVATGSLEAWIPWVLYALHHLSAVFLIDCLEIFGVTISDINHTRSFWPSLLIWSFRLALSIGALQLVAHAARTVAVYNRQGDA